MRLYQALIFSEKIIDLCDSYGFYARFVPEYEKYNFILKVRSEEHTSELQSP